MHSGNQRLSFIEDERASIDTLIERSKNNALSGGWLSSAFIIKKGG